ncbi:MAG TPA: DUF1476 domain-containing protein [Rhizomicrobium sp.]|jgi:hypothetical protein|nr:DUF1476 domain-containing protein [Rhizomicrobium sp.]
MSDAFKERGRGYESKWAHDAEMRFRVTARRNKLLGLWAAAEMGIKDEAAEDYARSVIRADMEEPGDEDVFRKLRADFDAAGTAVSDQAIRSKLRELMDVAGEQVSAEDKR